MGFFSSQPSEQEKRATEVRTGAVAPSRAERQKCWAARDAYFACLDANAIVDPLKEDKAAARACGPEGKGFEMDCASQWVCRFLFLLFFFFVGLRGWTGRIRLGVGGLVLGDWC